MKNQLKKEKVFLYLILIILVAFYIYGSIRTIKIGIDEDLKSQMNELKNVFKTSKENISQIKKVFQDFSQYITSTSNFKIENLGEKYLFINQEEGYEITLPKNLVIYKSPSTKIVHFADTSKISPTAKSWDFIVISLFVVDLHSKQSLETSSTTQIEINGESFLRAEYDSKVFYQLTKNEKVYEIFALDPYEDYLKTFRLIPTQK